MGGGGGWGAQLDTLSEAVLLPPTQWGERGGIGASASSIQQRSAGAAGGGAEMAGAGSWLLGALAVLASSPEMARRCLVAGPHAKRGVLALRIWNTGMCIACAWRVCMACVHGVCAWRVRTLLTLRLRNTDRWTVLLTDDRLPCHPDGPPLYGSCAAPHHVVFALLLKGYAKLYGGYAALRAGRVTEALVDFTGGVSHKVAPRTSHLCHAPCAPYPRLPSPALASPPASLPACAPAYPPPPAPHLPLHLRLPRWIYI